MKGGAPPLGDITKPPVKMKNVPNPYLKNRAGIGKFVVSKASIPHRPPTQNLRTMTTPSQRKPSVISRDTGEGSLATNKGDDGHIVREKSGKIYNPASETMPGPPQITTEAGADLQGHSLTPCDLKLWSVYGDHIHCNDGTHLAGGISDDALWHTRWRRISNLTPRFYDAQKGKAGRSFVILLTEGLQGARERRWNS